MCQNILAKFYGRAGLINLLNSGPDHLRPAIFKSLLYEACGRIVNPIYGSVGLLWSGSWQLCQNAVDAVLGGSPITTIACDDAATASTPLLKGYDIRHVTEDDTSTEVLHRVKARPGRFKRAGTTRVLKPKAVKAGLAPALMTAEANRGKRCGSTSHESSMSHETIEESLVSSEDVEAAAGAVPGSPEKCADDEKTEVEVWEEDGEVELELTLGFRPTGRRGRVAEVKSSTGGGACKVELGLD
ncbi:hypothetical protein Dimus_034029 [Dionaea muscipula]